MELLIYGLASLCLSWVLLSKLAERTYDMKCNELVGTISKLTTKAIDLMKNGNPQELMKGVPLMKQLRTGLVETENVVLMEKFNEALKSMTTVAKECGMEWFIYEANGLYIRFDSNGTVV